MIHAYLKLLRGWLAAVAVLAVAYGIVSWRMSGPAPRGLDASEEVFAAARASAELRDVLGDGSAHPVGSEAQARVRARLLLKLEALGYAPEVQTGTACSRWGACSHVANIIATLPGRDADAVLVCAHYDSVGAGPGAGDDGAGVATVLEVARALKARHDAGRALVLLLTDGEEAGLLGARLFVREHPLTKRVRVAINVEARGSAGPSLMFETSGATRPLIMGLQALPHPITGSLFGAVYRRMPNDTDFSVLSEAGIAGYNFAFIEELPHYHTPLDDLAHLDQRSLQHHGDNVLALVRALTSAEANADSRGDAVWFDWLGLMLVWWPLEWSLGIALGIAVVLVLLLVAHARRAEARRILVGAGASLLAALAACAVASALGYGVMLLIGLRGSAPWYAHPEPATLALVSCALGAASWAATWLSKLPSWSRYSGVWILWSFMGVAVAKLLPEACYLAIAPCAVAVLVGALALLLGRERAEAWAPWLALVPASLAATMWLALATGLHAAVGLVAHPAITGALVLCFTAFIPPLGVVDDRARTHGPLVCAAVLALATSAALVVPTYSAHRPARQSISHVERDEGASWVVDTTWAEPSEALVGAASLETRVPSPIPLVGFRDVAIGAAPRIDAPGPTLERVRAESDSDKVVHVRLRSARAAPVMAVLLPPDAPLAHAAVEGQAMPIRRVHSRSPWYADHQLLTYLSTPPPGVLMELRFVEGMPREVIVVDVVRGLPEAAAPLLEARGLLGTPSQDGDLSIVARRAQL